MALTYNIQFRADTKSLQSQIAIIQRDLNKAFDLHLGGEIGKELYSAVQSANILEKALAKATTINGTSMIAFNSELRKAGVNVETMLSNFSGAQMREASSALINTFTFANRGAIVLNEKIQEMGRVLLQSFKFSTAQQFIRFMQGALDDGLRWSKDLNKALTDISIVTEKVGADLDKAFDSVLEGSRKLGIAAKEYAQAALIFYQQGLPDQEVQARTDITIKAAKAAGTSVIEMSEQLTAVWNTYKMQGEQLANAASIGAKIGAETAVDFKYIAEAMQVAATAGAQLGVSYESLVSIIATVGETTLQSASLVGNAYKTIFARLTNLKTTGEDAGESLGRITQALSDLGFNILEASGEMKSVDDIINQLGNSWDNYSNKQQIAIAQTVGGVRQFTQFLALMQNFDKYETNLASAMTEGGDSTLNAQFAVWQDSIEAAAARAKESWASAFGEMFNQDAIKAFYNLVEDLGNVFGNLTQAMGGIPGILTLIATIMHKQIVSGAVNLLATGREILSNLTIKQRAANALVAAEKQLVAVQQQIVQAHLGGQTGLKAELQITERKLETNQKIAGVVTKLQDLQQRGNAQQQLEATTKLQVLNTAQQQLFSQLDQNRALELELQAVQNILNSTQVLSVEEEARLVALRDELQTQKLISDERVNQAQQSFDDAAETSGENIPDPAGAKSYGEALMGMAGAAMTATFAISSLVGMLKGEVEPSFAGIMGIVMQLGMAFMTFTQAMATSQGLMTAMSAGLNKMAGSIAVNIAGFLGLGPAGLTAGNLVGAGGVIASLGWGPFLLVILAVIAAIAILVIAVAGVIAIFKAWEASTPEAKLRAAEEATQQLGAQLQETREAADNLRKSFDSYDEIRERLSGLVKGTQEWKEAIQEANQVSMDILNKNPELYNFIGASGKQGVTRDKSTGLINISDEAREYIDLLAQAEVGQATAASIAGQQKLREAQINVDTAKLARDIGNSVTSASGVIGGVIGGATAGALTATVPGLIGGAIVGAFAGDALVDRQANDLILKAMENFTGEMKDDRAVLEAAFEGFGPETDKYVDAAMQQHKSLMELKTAIDANTAAKKIENETAAQAILQANEMVQKSEFADEIGTRAGALYGQLMEKAEADAKSRISSRGLFATGTDKSKDAMAEFLAAIGQTGAKVTNYTGDGTVKYMHTAEDGTVEEREVNDEFIASTLAAAKAQEELNNQIGAVVQKFEQLSNSVDAGDKALLNFLSDGNLEASTLSKIEDLRSDVNIAGSTEAYLGQQFGDMDGVLTEEEAQAMGYKTAQDMINALDEALAIEWPNIQLPSGSSLPVEDISLATANKLSKLLGDDINAQGTLDLGPLGEKGGETFAAGLEKMISQVAPGLDGKDVQRAMEAMVDIDWSSWDAAEQAKARVEALGYEIGMTDEEFVQFAEDMRMAAGATPIQEFLELKQTMSDIMRITSDLDIGSTISEEDYQRLIELNKELEKHFILMADGSRKMVSSFDPAEAFNIEEMTAEMFKAAELFEGISDQNWGWDHGTEAFEAFDWDRWAAEGDKYFESIQKGGEGSSKAMVEALADADGATQAFLESLGYTDDILTDIATNGSAEQVEEVARRISEAMQAGMTGDEAKTAAAEMWASSAGSIRELNQMLADGRTDVESYQKAWQGLVGSVKQCKEALDSISSSDFSGNFQEQTDQLMLFNAQLMTLGVGPLATEFLGLTEAEQEQVLALKQLEAATLAYNEALKDIDPTAAVIAFNDLSDATAKAFDLDSEDLNQYAKHLANLTDKSGELSPNLKDNQKLALEVAKSVMRMDKGIESLADGLENWSDILKNSKRTSQEYVKALGEIREAMGDLVNAADSSTLSEEFLTSAENLKLMEEAAKGNVEAIGQLWELAAQDYFINIVAVNATNKEELMIDFQTMMAEFQALPDADLAIGAHLNDGDFVAAANSLIKNANMTADQVNEMFGRIGLKPKLKMVEQTVEQTNPIVETTTTSRPGPSTPVPYPVMNDGVASVEYMDLPSTIRTESSRTIGYSKQPGVIQVPELDVDSEGNASFEVVSNPSMSNFSPTNAGGGPPGGGGKGGGGSKAAKATRPSKDRERYKDTTTSLTATTRALDRLNSAEDKAFGMNKLVLMSKKNKELQEQASLYDKLSKEAKKYLEIDDRRMGMTFGKTSEGKDRILGGKMGDKERLQQMASILQNENPALTLDIKFNEEGMVSNAEVMLDNLNALLHEKWEGSTQWNATEQSFVFTSEAAEASYKNFEEMINGFTEQIQQVDDTAQKVKDEIANGLATIHEWLSNKLNEVEYKMNLRIRINERDLQQLQWLLGRLGDGSSVAHMENLNKQVSEMIKKANALGDAATRYLEIEQNLAANSVHQSWFKEQFGEEAWAEYQKTGHITDEMMEKMVSTAEEMQQLIRDLWEMNTEMWRQWHIALQGFVDDFDSLIGLYDSHSSMLESWTNIWRVAGKPWANQRLNIDLLNKAIDTQSSKVQGLQQKYEFLNSKIADAEALYQRALQDYADDPEGQIIIQERREEWEKLKIQAVEAKADMMSEVSAMMDMIESAAAEAAAVIVHEFTEGLNGIFSEVDSALAMLGQKRSIDTFFLHEEDLAFELSKMLREMGKDMEDVTDPALLEKYSEWMQKVNDIKESGVKMTQTELDILKAEFDLEKAQAAFQEQQQMKNTMRLTRDASGNWSYLYSADGGEEEDTEANIEEKIHNIRKMHREAADEAADMWLEVWAEYNKYIQEIDWQRYEQNEAYRTEVDTRMRWYEEQMDQHSGQIIKHNDAIDRSFTDMSLSVIIDMSDMETANNKYKQNNQEMTEALKANHDEYQQKAKETLEAVGISYDDLEVKIQEETDDIMAKNKENEDSIKELRETADSELDAMMDKTMEWADRWKSDIEEVIAKLNELIAKIFELEAAQSGTSYTAGKDYSASIAQGKERGMSREWAVGEATELYYKFKDAWNNQLQLAVDQGMTPAEAERYMSSVRGEWNNGRWDPDISLADFINKELLRYGYLDGGLASGYQIASLSEDGKRELVLNNSDTENFLAAIQIMRDSIAAHLTSIGMKQAGIIGNTRSGIVDSDVQPTPVIIQADFPNVSAREEIEAAFSNLVNQAAQYQLKPRS